MMVHLKNRFFSPFILCFLFLLIPFAVFSQEVSLTFYHTTDLHDSSQSLSRIAQIVADRKENDPNVLFLDTGDWFNKGDLTPLNSNGEAMASLMGLCRYDAVILGNHDYSFGTFRLLNLVERHSLPLLAANCIWPDEIPHAPIPAYKIFPLKGVTVAVIGIASHYLNHKLDDLPTVDFSIEDLGDLIEILDPQADILVLMTHTGGTIDRDLVLQFPNLDLIVGGHDHQIYHEMVYNEETQTILHHSGSSGRYLGEITLIWDGSSITDRKTRMIEITPDLSTDPHIEAMVDRFKTFPSYVEN